MPGKATEFTLADVARHNSARDGWIAVHGHVYDITHFIQTHPGTSGDPALHSHIVGTTAMQALTAESRSWSRRFCRPVRLRRLYSDRYTGSSWQGLLRGISLPFALMRQVSCKIGFTANDTTQCQSIALGFCDGSVVHRSLTKSTRRRLVSSCRHIALALW